MSITEAQARRALRHADIPWDGEVDDPREEAWVVHDHQSILGVLSIDGKGTWSRADGPKVDGARQSSYDADGSSLQTFGALRATLTSSSVCPCVGQQLIGSKEGEATAFRELLPRICDEFGGQFRIVTGDAGLCARENGALVTKLARWYVFGLKGNQARASADRV